MKQIKAKYGSHCFIGMVHLPPLPGAPRFGGELADVYASAEADAGTLMAAGADGFIIENFGDAPFYPERTPTETVAVMSALSLRLRDRHPEAIIGINVLRNDGAAALAIAVAASCDLIRVNILNGARLTDQGIIQGQAHAILRERRRLEADVAIFADVDVKHSAPLAVTPLRQQAEELAGRGGADGLIVSGSGTGKRTSLEDIQEVNQIVTTQPVWVGSGVTLANIADMTSCCQGFIVGTALKQNGELEEPIDASTAARFAEAIKAPK